MTSCREVALAATPFDRASRAMAAMQMIANIRDFPVADLSPAGEAPVDEAIDELMDDGGVPPTCQATSRRSARASAWRR